MSSVNLDFAGKTYPASAPVTISAAKIREFAAATGATSALHTDVAAAKAAGFDNIIAPPTFAVSLAQQSEGQYIADPDAGIDFSRVVHGEERFQHVRPLVAGEAVTTTLTVSSVKIAGGHGMVSTSVDIRDAADQTVCIVQSTIVVRGA